MKRTQILESVVIGLVVGVLVMTAGTVGPGPSSANVAALVSWNPEPADRFHAPLSSFGLIGATGAEPDFQAMLPSTPTAPTGSGSAGASTGMTNISVNAMRFIADTSYISQSETTVAVTDSGGSTYVLGGYNDARYFFCYALPKADCPSGWTFSLSGFSLAKVTGLGPQFLASDDLPGIVYRSTSNGGNYVGFLVSWGDPSIASTTNGNFYYASLSIDPFTGNNGIALSISNSKLLLDPASCKTLQGTPWTNPCWTTKFIFGSKTGFISSTTGKPSHVPLTFEDKELIAVDQNPASTYYGDAYVAWDHFNADGTSASFLARCDPSLTCVMLAGGSLPPLSGSDPFAGFTTPAVAPNGAVYVTWCNFGTFTTLGPIACRVRASPAGGVNFGPAETVVSFDGKDTMFPTYSGLVGYATEQFRTFSIPSLAAYGPIAGTGSNKVYFVIAVCSAGNFYGFYAPATPGNCGSSAILFARSTDGGMTWSSPKVIADGHVNEQPWVTADPSNGNVSVVHYTTQFDPFNHRIDVVSQYTRDNGESFQMRRLTNVSNEPNSEPMMYDYLVSSGFGGSFLVPQYGDYFQAVGANGKLYVVFTGNYNVELGAFQDDPFLTIVSG